MSQVCAHCGDDIEPEDVRWVDPETDEIVTDGSGGDPYHEECLP